MKEEIIIIHIRFKEYLRKLYTGILNDPQIFFFNVLVIMKGWSGENGVMESRKLGWPA